MATKLEPMRLYDFPYDWCTVPRDVSKLEIPFVRCEMHNARCIVASEECWRALVELIESSSVGIKVIEREIDPRSSGVAQDYHRFSEAIRALFTVQGLPYNEGVYFVPALESLIAEYAKLK